MRSVHRRFFWRAWWAAKRGALVAPSGLSRAISWAISAALAVGFPGAAPCSFAEIRHQPESFAAAWAFPEMLNPPQRLAAAASWPYQLVF